MKKNKRGVISIIIFFALLLVVLVIGFLSSIAIGVIDYTSDTITPIMEDIGVVGATNISEVSEYTFGTADKIVQSLPWLIGFSYVVMLIISVLFVVIYPSTSHPAFIGFYFILIILLVFFSILMSNMYQDIYTGSDDLSQRLQEQTLLSFMILHSPAIMVLIAFVTGIFLFTRTSEEGGGGGNYGI